MCAGAVNKSRMKQNCTYGGAEDGGRDIKKIKKITAVDELLEREKFENSPRGDEDWFQ